MPHAGGRRQVRTPMVEIHHFGLPRPVTGLVLRRPVAEQAEQARGEGAGLLRAGGVLFMVID